MLRFFLKMTKNLAEKLALFAQTTANFGKK
jgi:hypothetical protein